MRLSWLLFALLALNGCSDAYKILVFAPRFSQSISNFLGNIADTLVEAGHDVTTLIPIVNPVHRDGTHKSKKVYVQQGEETKKLTEGMNFGAVDFFNFNDFDIGTAVGMGDALCTWMNAQCAAVLDEPGLIDNLTAAKFDVMIVENFETCGIALSSLIRPKSLITSTGSVPFAWMFGEFGLDAALSYDPSMSVSHLDVHSIWSRAWNLYAEAIARATWYNSRSQVDSLFIERFGADFPGVTQIASHAAFTLVNSETLIDYAVPTLSRIQYIGGIGAKAPKQLDEELSRLLDLRPRSVLLSFGSVVVSAELPAPAKRAIVETIARFPDVTFLWKYERPEDDFAKAALASTPNLHMLKWTPQNDLLADPRLTAFITHGGMASTQEVALRGKPGLFIPFFGDQPRNAGMMERSGVGRVFDKRDLLSAPKFHAAVQDLLENDSYRKTAARIGAMIAKKPFSARETLIRTIEFAAEFGPSASLRPQSFDMTWIEYYNADIILVFASVLIVLSVASLKLLCVLFRRVSRKSKQE